MSIFVVCPGCHKRFTVGDQYAGKTGPCPKCKTAIRVPKKDEEVQVHAPTKFGEGGRSVTGELLTKPIERKAIKLSPVVGVAIVGAGLLVLLVTWVIGQAGLFQQNLITSAIGLLLVSPPLVVAGYTFLRSDDELKPHQGPALYLRAGICSLAYVGLWWAFGRVANQALTGELWNWFFVAPPFFFVGALVALACLDLDFGSGFFHYCFYVLLTMVLRWAAGMDWVWQIANNPMG